MTRTRATLAFAIAVAVIGCAWLTTARADEKLTQQRVRITPSMVKNEAPVGEPAGLVDEQDAIVGPPAGSPDTTWNIPSQYWKDFPYSAHIDLGETRKLATLWIYDTNGKGDLLIETGKPGKWEELTTYDCGKYMAWASIPVERETRFIRFTRFDGGSNFTEIALYEYTPEAYEAMLAKKEAEAKAEAERQAALEKAREEMRKRPLVDAGEPFGKLYLVDEIVVADVEPVQQYPANASTIETILGQACRVLPKTDGEATYFSYQIGKMKLLEPGMTYVLQVEYPEDAPRSVIVMNAGDETSRGFHTGRAFGDAYRPKYVNNLSESIDVPLSGQFETWSDMFQLHDRTPFVQFIRGEDGERNMLPEDGFTVTIAQFSKENIPYSHGAAVSRIRLLAVPEPEQFDAKYTLPEGLPHRHLFWREEMADGVVQGGPEKRGVTNQLDWWRYKRDTMKFLGMNTYTKDLLEFGAVQHWDSSPHGGNKWAYFAGEAKDWWPQIVQIMGDAGFDVLPYYEYAGSKGQQGLGNERRAKPLTRDDAYSHIKWIESANADLTDPDTYEDFKKMLDVTVVRQQDKANFLGAWIRTRAQLPMSFADTTLARFAEEANGGTKITRKNLIDDTELLKKYKTWWYGKRRDFFLAMRDYLRDNGIADAMILYTASAGEPGEGFPTWDPVVVTDDVPGLTSLLASPEAAQGDKKSMPISVDSVVQGHKYLEAVLAERLNWGGWELNHATPPSDPATYKDDEGVMLTLAFNRLYTVADPAPFDAFRNKTGLTIMRHFTLNENMMFDKADQPILGYFVVDFESAGPYSMMAEAYAMANGDPTHIGYLSGGNYSRGFPQYVRSFNTAFLSLPALPSTIVQGASDDSEIVVREIKTEGKGTYYAVISLGMDAKDAVTVRLPASGKVTDAATGEAIDATGNAVTVSMHPFQLRALRVQ